MDTNLNLLIVDESLNDAEAFVSHLRNAGIAARSTCVSDPGDMEDALLENIDLLLCANEFSAFPPEKVIALLKNDTRDLPILVIAKEPTQDLYIEILRLGARDIVNGNNVEHISLIIKREMQLVDMKKRLKHAEQQLKETEDRCSALMESSRDAIGYMLEGMHIAANSVYLKKFGYDDPDDLLGIPVLDMIAPEDHKKFKQFLRAYEKNGKPTDSIEVRGQMPDGSTFDALLELSPASVDGETCTQVIIREKANSQELEQKIEHLSKLDLLTGLFNRQHFMKSIEAILATEDGAPFSLFYIMIDDFKKIRDTVGITDSDQVIAEIAQVIKSLARESDILTRFDDHVFTFLSQGRTSEEIAAFAEQIRISINGHKFEKSDQFVTTECSIGVEHMGGHLENSQEFLYNASTACETANIEGGNQVRIHNPIRQNDKKEVQQHSPEALKYALGNDLFSLLYQPIVGLQGDETENYCVLLRMQNKDGELILPENFLPAAMQHNLIFDVDCWVITHALQTLSEQRTKGRQLNLFIKVAGPSLSDKLLLHIVECMKKSKVHGSWIVFEIDDIDVRTYLQQMKSFINGLAKIKCRFAMDNFGIEANAEDMLHQIPANFIKIHGNLIKSLPDDEKNLKIVKQINDLAHEKGMKIIAKSVEDANTLALLWSTSMDYIQGYFLQEPTHELNYDFSGDNDDDDE